MSTRKTFYQNGDIHTVIARDRDSTILRAGVSVLAQIDSKAASQSRLLLGSDQQDSPILEADNERPRVAAYTPYGVEKVLRCWIGFTGAVRDGFLSGYMLGNGYRLYNPVLMRFCSPDSFSPFVMMNSYAYCEGDPVNRSDRSGHMPNRNWTQSKSLLPRLSTPPPPTNANVLSTFEPMVTPHWAVDLSEFTTYAPAPIAAPSVSQAHAPSTTSRTASPLFQADAPSPTPSRAPLASGSSTHSRGLPKASNRDLSKRWNRDMTDREKNRLLAIVEEKRVRVYRENALVLVKGIEAYHKASMGSSDRQLVIYKDIPEDRRRYVAEWIHRHLGSIRK